MKSSPIWRKIITSTYVDEAALGLLVAAAVAVFEVIFKALPGFFILIVANFLPALAESLPKFLKNCLVLQLLSCCHLQS